MIYNIKVWRLYKILMDFVFGIDSVLLSDFAKKIRPGSTICDLGTGTGIISILLSKKVNSSKIIAFEKQRDVFDMEIYKTAIKFNKPVFGICRGFQIINVVNGGTLYQDLSYADFVKLKHDQQDNPSQATHFVKFEEGTFLRDILGEESKVNSFHHQILKDVAPGFKVVAKSPDGVVESIQKITEDCFVVGVQWHPEMLSVKYEDSQKVFDEFVKKVIEYKK